MQNAMLMLADRAENYGRKRHDRDRDDASRADDIDGRAQSERGRRMGGEEGVGVTVTFFSLRTDGRRGGRREGLTSIHCSSFASPASSLDLLPPLTAWRLLGGT